MSKSVHIYEIIDRIMSRRRLLIGGAAGVAGAALTAWAVAADDSPAVRIASRLRTALVEADDFASGTSSRSTKLIHGGVRYLQKAILQLDYDQYKMVKEALHERANMLEVAPHLTRPLPILLPVYKWWQVPYYWFGIKMYDLVAGQQDDARMNLAIALTAARHGATIANHVSCLKLYKTNGKLSGARLKSGESRKRSPFIFYMDDVMVTDCPEHMGLLDPATSDGRVIFFLPWLKGTIAGTTDLPCNVTHNPKPTEDEILFILTEVKNYLNPDVEVSDPNKPDTQSLARNHIVHVSPAGLVTIAGGKWTTYRAMAAETIDAAIESANLKPLYKECQTDGFLIEGAHGWTPTMYIRLVQDFGLEMEVAQHLAKSYGDRAFAVAKMAAMTGKRWPIIGKKVHPEFPYIDAEIRYGCREYARTAVDMIARRLRLAFLNVQAAAEALPTIKQIKDASDFLANEMGQMVNRASRDKIPINLSKDEIQTYIKRFQIIDKDRKGFVSINDIRRSLKSMGLKPSDAEISAILSEIDVTYHGQLELQDYLQGSCINVPSRVASMLVDVGYGPQNYGEEVTGEQLHEILKEIDTNMNGQVELDEYLQMMSAIKSGHVAYSRFARMAEMEEEHHEQEMLKKQISVERSGGGL
ncbi:hypothetical protein HF086_010433 [Spodoptera exigua]|uniref:glycerol-3-phosphate dehydrogenase n=1 Tax=Spodoptera exigua TaxID=7107 RepID=A0A922MUV6_SPOEX|nr:hypothetical protein HF086_010433 [Spodoptera exigua]